MATRKGWTQEDYAKAGKTTLLLRLENQAAKNLAEVSMISGATRQKIIEAFLADKELVGRLAAASLEQPAYEPADFVDPPKTTKTTKKARKSK